MESVFQSLLWLSVQLHFKSFDGRDYLYIPAQCFQGYHNVIGITLGLRWAWLLVNHVTSEKLVSLWDFMSCWGEIRSFYRHFKCSMMWQCQSVVLEPFSGHRHYENLLKTMHSLSHQMYIPSVFPTSFWATSGIATVLKSAHGAPGEKPWSTVISDFSFVTHLVSAD